MSFKNLSVRLKIVTVNFITLMLMIALGGISYYSIGSLLERHQWVNHTHLVLEEASSMKVAAVNMQTGMRGFLLSGKEKFLEPYDAGRRGFDQLTSNLQKKVSDDPAQVALLGEITKMIYDWQTVFAEPMIKMRRQVASDQDMANVIASVQEEREKIYFDQFRAQIAKFRDREKALIAQREFDSKNQASWSRQLIVFGMIFVSIGMMVISYLLSNLITNPLKEALGVAQGVAEGNLSIDIKVERTDELGVLAEALRKMVASLKQKVALAENIAKGDLPPKVYLSSEQDELGLALEKMLFSLKQKVKVAQAVAEGNLKVDNKLASENDVLGKALQTMIERLALFNQTSGSQKWLSDGAAQVNEEMRGDRTTAEIASSVLSVVAKYVDAQVGLFYVVTSNDRFKVASSFALTVRKHMNVEIESGEGIVGQAILERQMFVVTDLPEGYMAVQSGSGEQIPRQLLAVPLMVDGEVLGAIEIGSFHELTAQHREYFDLICEPIAIALRSAKSRKINARLLEQTSLQAEELRNQTEELEAQQEHLQIANSELEQRSKVLEEQSEVIKEKNKRAEEAKHLIEVKAKELTLSNKYKSEFLANMSHELRTPMNSILALSQNLAENKEKNLKPKQITHAKTIHDSGNSLLKLINDILDLSKVEAGKLEIVHEAISPQQIVEGLQRMFQPLVEKKGLVYHTVLPADLPEVVTDSHRVQQILRNFLSNAVKFTNSGEITLKVETSVSPYAFSHPEVTDQQAVFFHVQDSGTGIPQDKLAVIFEAFKQGDGSISRTHGGTGLGLSISKELASLLGGEIRVESTSGEGSQFTLILPLKAPQVDRIFSEDGRLNVELSASSIEGPGVVENPAQMGAALVSSPDKQDEQQVQKATKRLTGKSILIADDDMRNVYTLSSLLEHLDVEIHVANDGVEALQLLSDHPKMDLVIMDVMMPKMDGYTAIQKIREQSEFKELPILVLTAKAMAGERKKALGMGADAYLTKPLDRDRILITLGGMVHD